jgi:hypothetical protein
MEKTLLFIWHVFLNLLLPDFVVAGEVDGVFEPFAKDNL